MGVYAVSDYVIYISILILVLGFIRRFLFSYISFDKRFIILISPYILLGIFIRLLADAGFFERDQLWSITPGVYILCVFIASVGIGAGLLINRYLGVGYWIPPFILGLVGVIYTGFNLLHYVVMPERILYPLSMAACIACLFILIRVPPFNRRDNVLLIFAHMLDASSTFIAHDFYGFDEEHLLPRFLIGLTGGSAVIMLPVKLALILVVVYTLERYYRGDKEDELLYKMLKVLIFILGIGPGTRNSILPSLDL